MDSVVVTNVPTKSEWKLWEKILVGGVIVFTIVVIIVLVIWMFTRNRMLLQSIAKPTFNVTTIDVEKEKREILHKKKSIISAKPQLKKGTIAVMISSYRDPELCLTIQDLYEKALFPNRIFLKVVEQNDSTDSFTCHSKNADVLPELYQQIKFKTMHYKDAKGPTYARSLCEKMWDGEDYHMMTDSHMRFEPGWDLYLLDMLWKSPRPTRTVLTGYPEGYRREEKNGVVNYTINMRKGWRTHRWKYFNDKSVPEFESITQLSTPPDVPPLTGFWGACFHFSHSDTLRLVPFSPNTPYLFFGEEAFMAARYFTNGFDLRAPCFSVVYHLWQREYRATYWSHDNSAARDRSIQLVKDIMLGRVRDDRHGLGRVRSWRDYWTYVGLDPFEKKPTRPHDPWRPPENWKTLSLD